MSSPRNPPFTITTRILGQVAECCERVGSWRAGRGSAISPQLRRENRIRSIQASLAIENNSLSIDQVTDILDGKRVIGLPREIQEVKNAITCYDSLGNLDPTSVDSFLKAHEILRQALADDAGTFRSGGVGVYREDQLIHMAPPAERIPLLIAELFTWFGDTDLHPLIASSILHYEIEFIHPFSDGNGRMGRLWQTLALTRWHPGLAYLPVESVIREHQSAYYEALGEADKKAEATPFIEFVLDAIAGALKGQSETDPVTDPVTDSVKSLLKAFVSDSEKLTTEELLKRLELRHKPSFRKNYLHPALADGMIEMTEPQSPHSPTQRYHLTRRGKRMKQTLAAKS